ncbi:hypothetical protein [Pseudonocardia acidicola]|uniref:Uncharacterized protein n=1 Tax=Pseudonocardia acidicola TaxID=2724939 RepID=A0ABX1S2S4_9PSEU|nr:hypothetical protein [Pseudonocardia acidicola]NMH95843.1 hypothetical protein [Pseudonocardia acidicola]
MRLGRKLAEGFAADPDADRAVPGTTGTSAEPRVAARERAGTAPVLVREPESVERPAEV